LVPANPGGWPNFCERDNEGALVIHVQNKGDGYALCSTALIEFPGSGISMPLQVPAIPPGETYELDHIRSGQPCFPDLDCFFRITVDYDSICEESDETNNSVEGKCTG